MRCCLSVSGLAPRNHCYIDTERRIPLPPNASHNPPLSFPLPTVFKIVASRASRLDVFGHLRRYRFGLFLVAVAIGCAEISARIDDWVRYRIPLTHTPDYEHDLKFRDWFGVRGRPSGQYYELKLNNYGFRGEDVTRLPRAGCTRIMALGASETVGISEASGQEYPAQLRDTLRRHGCFEVLNSAIAGAGLKSLIRLWDFYSSDFSPRSVIIYPSPSFYLADEESRWSPVASAPPKDLPVTPQPRLLQRVYSSWHTPDIVQRYRLRRWIAADSIGKGADWVFRSPPTRRLDIFMTDLDSLVKSIRARGSEPVLVTHAMRFDSRVENGDEQWKLVWRRNEPRATSETILAFEVLAAQRMRAYAAAENVRLVDAERVMSGRRELFSDFVHFTRRGSATMAGLISRELESPRPSGRDSP